VPCRIRDVAHPALVRAERIDRQADDLRVALVELALQAPDLPGSVVQTGVKSFGCEERSPRLCAGQRQLWPQRDGLATPGPGDDPLRKQQPPEPSGRAYQPIAPRRPR